MLGPIGHERQLHAGGLSWNKRLGYSRSVAKAREFIAALIARIDALLLPVVLTLHRQHTAVTTPNVTL